MPMRNNGTLLGLFGVKSGDERAAEDELANRIKLQELVNTGQLVVEQERSKGSRETEETRGKNTIAETQEKAKQEYLKSLNLSPRAYAELEAKLNALDATRVATGQERADQGLSDARKGTALRGANKQMNDAVIASEIADARQRNDASQKAYSVTTPPGSVTTVPSQFGPRKDYGAIESTTAIPSGIKGLPPTLVTGQEFPMTVDPADMQETEPVVTSELPTGTPAALPPINPLSSGLSLLPGGGVGMGGIGGVGGGLMAPQPDANTLLSTLMRAMRKNRTVPQPQAFPGRIGGY